MIIYVTGEPVSLSPSWVHLDRRRGTAACASGGYPITRKGSIGAYVLVLQEALNSLGHGTGGLDGIFGTGTENAVLAYQKKKGLIADGIVGCLTWSNLMYDVIPKTATLEPVD